MGCENLKPLREWFSKEDPNPEVCRPCYLRTLAGYYLGALEEGNEKGLVKEFEEIYEKSAETEDILTIAETMDNIKGKVEPSLKQKLKELDCMVQNLDTQ